MRRDKRREKGAYLVKRRKEKGQVKRMRKIEERKEVVKIKWLVKRKEQYFLSLLRRHMAVAAYSVSSA